MERGDLHVPELKLIVNRDTRVFQRFIAFRVQLFQFYCSMDMNDTTIVLAPSWSGRGQQNLNKRCTQKAISFQRGPLLGARESDCSPDRELNFGSTATMDDNDDMQDIDDFDASEFDVDDRTASINGMANMSSPGRHVPQDPRLETKSVSRVWRRQRRHLLFPPTHRR